MSDPVDPQSPPATPISPEPVPAPPTAGEPVFAGPPTTSWATSDEPAADSLPAVEPQGPAAAIDDADAEITHESDDEFEVIGTAPWVSMATATGLGLALVAAVEVVVFIAQGLATKTAGISALLRIGSGFFNNLDNGQIELVLILATVLLVLPAIGEQGTTDRHDRSAALGFALTSSFAVIVGIAAVVGVLYELKAFHLQSPGNPLPAEARRLLTGYLVRHLGLSVVALIASIGAMRARFAPPAEVADDPAVTGA